MKIDPYKHKERYENWRERDILNEKLQVLESQMIDILKYVKQEEALITNDNVLE